MSLLSKIFSRGKYKPQEPQTPRHIWTYNGGQSVNPDTAMKVSAFYSGVMFISTQVAKLPWRVKDSDNNVLYKDPIHTLIDLAPNPEMNSFSFRLLAIQTAIVYGDFFAEIERDRQGRPVALWPILPDSVQVTRLGPDKELVYRVVGGAHLQPGEDAYLLPRDVYHVKNFHLTADGLRGQGLTYYAQNTLGISLGADSFASGLYQNAGMPSGVLKTEGALGEEAYDRIKDSWKSAVGGRKVGGTAILEAGLTFEPITFTPEIMQFLESRKFSVIEIARFLRVPPPKLYDVDTSTYNNIEHANLEVATDVLDAWTRNFEMEADIKLLKRRHGGRRTEMEIYDIFRGDMDTRSQYFSRLMQDAALTPNEIRKKEGMAPYAEGDRYYIANNNFAPVDRLDEIIDSQTKEEEVEEEVETPEEAESEVDEAIVNYLKSKS